MVSQLHEKPWSCFNAIENVQVGEILLSQKQGAQMKDRKAVVGVMHS